VPVARFGKTAVRIPVVAVGLITGFEQAESIISTGDADFVALARGMLYDPRWPWHAAAFFGEQIRAPKQYLRSEPGRTRFSSSKQRPSEFAPKPPMAARSASTFSKTPS
jgi:2,4-dienoyl-CoA reductase-like NADH-dependent reductase (Old Yellow Enzyme family)